MTTGWVRSRRGVAAVMLVVGSVAIGASVAYACQVLTTMRVTPTKGRPGTEVTGTGANYSSDPAASPVEVRLDSRSGRLLWSGTPDATRNINFSFTIPRVKRGYHTLLATQYTATGSPVAGTPGRATIKVIRRTAAGAVAAPVRMSEPGGRGLLPEPTTSWRTALGDTAQRSAMALVAALALLGLFAGGRVTARRLSALRRTATS